jgi:hypothetical protein
MHRYQQQLILRLVENKILLLGLLYLINHVIVQQPIFLFSAVGFCERDDISCFIKQQTMSF